MSLAGKIGLVTGAGGGIGLATTAMFLERGMNVVATDCNIAPLEELKRQWGGDRLVIVPGDVTGAQENERFVTAALDVFGRLDVAFLNAGIAGPMKPTHLLSLEEFSRVIDVNLTAVFSGLKAVISAMLENGGGSIICTSSVQGLHACGYCGAYAASKHGVMGLVRNAALEYARHNIRINTVNPGVVGTDMMRRVEAELAPEDPHGVETAFSAAVPMGRYGKAEEIAGMVCFLASDEASYITGVPHLITGGMSVDWAPPMQWPSTS